MKRIKTILCVLLSLIAVPAIAQEQAHLSPQNGTIVLDEANAQLNLGQRYDFYSGADIRTIIVDIWENRPEQAEGVIGIIMPAGISPHEEGWGGIVTYGDTGWISNDDARSADYDALLSEMQDQAEAENFERREQGFPELAIVGWAQAPQYDSVSHTMIWARELEFSDSATNALSYDLRLLGRSGVLSINFVADMEQLPAIRTAARDIADAATYAPGSRYEDYEAGTDEAAGYGLAGLVASGAGLAVAKQLGALAVIAKFAKPLLVALGILLALMFAPLGRIFGRGKKRDEAVA